MYPSAHSLLPEIRKASKVWELLGVPFTIRPVAQSVKARLYHVLMVATPELKAIRKFCDQDTSLACTKSTLVNRGQVCKIRSTLISIWKGGSVKARHRVLVHELGHALGFDHDRKNAYSVMFPSNRPGPFEIPEKYQKALCKVYGYCVR